MAVSREHNREEKTPVCWVYILEQENNSCSIRFSLNLRKDLFAFFGQIHLLFYRGFSDVTVGVAYKLFLEKLSFNSLNRIITMKNPESKNLCDEFIETAKN